ncbi:formylglycine-generating enzyme family protein, partial [Candidatus Entotheonella palauensis]|uniref:formylglycine-generating enzyme family protein n=1 Tax=Candidatus Entotheonella palauensis TaxID=93172 RepID=UPI0021185E98
RAGLQASVWFEEVLELDPNSQDCEAVAADVAEAKRFLLAFQAMQDGLEKPSVEHLAWLSRVFGRLPVVAGYDPQLRQVWHQLYQLVSAHESDAEAPEWYDPAVISPADRPVRQMTLWQVANRLLVQPAQAQATVRGSPLGMVQTVNGEVVVAPGQREAKPKPFSWAHRWGWDDVGPWVTFRIGGAEQRLRWILAGRFTMGSPDDEEGRWEDEGPQHEVELSRGFWLFDTPCTQALWRAVMDDNPSKFRGDNRPVEQVSWGGCQAFIGAVNRRLPGLELSLPTEAQWEYACRAGTTAARYYDNVDAIAWYGDNSDGETHEVGQKRPNAWGLYDMLGNVYEWCRDGDYNYTGDAAVDPAVSAEAGAYRVIRGGSWLNPARLVRSAYRFAFRSASRDGNLGFRCSSSASEPARARGVWGESEQQAERAETAPRRPADRRRLRLQDESRVDTAWTQGQGFRVNTDRERLYVARITRPPWASEIGRDGYGLWAVLDVSGVRQRLRWIPPGRFWMGSPEDEEGRFRSEGPRHEVLLGRGFWLFDTLCTQALWQMVMGDNPSEFKGANRPVEQVSWADCQRFIERLNQRYTELALGLPTEAEWEYACRAGTEGPRYADDPDAIAWYANNSDLSTHDVGKKAANAWGLHDMLGNVWEWCYDTTRSYHRTAEVDPVGSLEVGVVRVIRGGCWSDPARLVRSAFRLAGRPGLRDGNLGFRCSSSGQASRQASREATASDRSSVGPEAKPTDAGRRRR